MILHISAVKQKAKQKPEGYLAEVLECCKQVGADECEISQDDFHRIGEKYSGHKLSGAGDLVALVAQPIAGAIDAVFGTELKGCGGCAQRQEALNKAIPFV